LSTGLRAVGGCCVGEHACEDKSKKKEESVGAAASAVISISTPHLSFVFVALVACRDTASRCLYKPQLTCRRRCLPVRGVALSTRVTKQASMKAVGRLE
jgi:hypothetical protein